MTCIIIVIVIIPVTIIKSITQSKPKRDEKTIKRACHIRIYTYTFMEHGICISVYGWQKNLFFSTLYFPHQAITWLPGTNELNGNL